VFETGAKRCWVRSYIPHSRLVCRNLSPEKSVVIINDDTLIYSSSTLFASRIAPLLLEILGFKLVLASNRGRWSCCCCCTAVASIFPWGRAIGMVWSGGGGWTDVMGLRTLYHSSGARARVQYVALLCEGPHPSPEGRAGKGKVSEMAQIVCITVTPLFLIDFSHQFSP
jgi:hypothetical protein